MLKVYQEAEPDGIGIAWSTMDEGQASLVVLEFLSA
jgi:hypothetical protein